MSFSPILLFHITAGWAAFPSPSYSVLLRQTGVNAKSFRGLAKPLVSCPQKRRRIDKHSGYQVSVDQANAEVVQTASLNHSPHLAQFRHSHLWQKVQQGKRPGAVLQRSKGKFCNDGRMDDDVPLVQMLPHFLVSRTKVLNPDGCIRENQFRPTLRRGIVFNFGIVPSRDANLRALSRSMRAFRASRINAVFSATPVNSWAIRTRSSSSATVVLIAPIIASYDVMFCASSISGRAILFIGRRTRPGGGPVANPV